jgi:UDP-N-acetylmuramoyl-L-alanyl-D-glutamate--2,6-diaminopimelate ligase
MKDLIKKFIPSFLINFYHFFLAFLGALIYWFPAKKLKVIGVTGTNGKSTVVEMISKILEEAGYKVVSLSSIKFKIDDKETANTLRMTMPGRFLIQKFLREAVNSGCKYAVLEVTSEGIKQYRHKFINFETAVFTNLSPEHIEAHGSFEKYREAKGKLFEATKNIHIINIDDENANYFLQFPANKKYTYGLNQGDINTQNTQFKLKLIGEFNIYNALAAICVGSSQGVNLETCKAALEKVEGIPGRMELVISEPFKVFVDYAFTPNALEKVYQTLTHQLINSSTNKLICVLGSCGGGRDRWKRPVLGNLAAKYCDEVIVTNEDPYNEDPMEIINQVARGAGQKFKKMLDRREAIRTALKIAKENDIIVITGKGCEPSICVAGGKRIPWDDRKVVKEEFRNITRFSRP